MNNSGLARSLGFSILLGSALFFTSIDFAMADEACQAGCSVAQKRCEKGCNGDTDCMLGCSDTKDNCIQNCN
ncbi:hypothetical protein [Legionella bononiensis]|uniref:Uncharacterized protein n=1 Tax=Legionella bononiensis TaxID=2793102 RepID=A0ABS1WDC2_9GAMM|nr:hypothetical protein [Legionella bononiensis]MBL7527362.1 hypothetical protein [Legionella bononiensis]